MGYSKELFAVGVAVGVEKMMRLVQVRAHPEPASEPQ